VLGLDLQVLGRPGVRHGQRRVEAVHQHAGGLPGQRGLDPLPVPRAGHPGGQRPGHPAGQPVVGGDQQAGGQRVVLGLGDQVRGDHAGVRGVVGDDRDLGRAGLGVGADRAHQQPLGRGT
jgi:hypothetical protein